MLRHLSPDRKRSETTTRRPASARSHATWEPMNPAPPVTKMKSVLDKFSIKGIATPNFVLLSYSNTPFQSFNGTLHHNTGDHGTGDGVQESEEFLQLVQFSVSDIDYVLVFDRKTLREKICIRVAHIQAVNDGRTAIRPSAQLWSIERGDDRRRLKSEQKHPGRIGTQVLQTASLRKRFGQGHPLRVKRELGVLSGRPEHRISLRHLDQGYDVSGVGIDIFGRLGHEPFHRDRYRDPAARETDEGVVDGGFRSTSKRDQIEKTIPVD